MFLLSPPNVSTEPPMFIERVQSLPANTVHGGGFTQFPEVEVIQPMPMQSMVQSMAGAHATDRETDTSVRQNTNPGAHAHANAHADVNARKDQSRWRNTSGKPSGGKPSGGKPSGMKPSGTKLSRSMSGFASKRERLKQKRRSESLQFLAMEAAPRTDPSGGLLCSLQVAELTRSVRERQQVMRGVRGTWQQHTREAIATLRRQGERVTLAKVHEAAHQLFLDS